MDLLWTCCGDKNFSISTTGPRHLQHVHNTFTTVYANGNAFTPRAKQSHNHYNTFTTNLRLICNKRTAILTTRLEFLQQFHNRSTITVSQQVYNRFTTGWFYMETRLNQRTLQLKTDSLSGQVVFSSRITSKFSQYDVSEEIETGVNTNLFNVLTYMMQNRLGNASVR